MKIVCDQHILIELAALRCMYSSIGQRQATPKVFAPSRKNLASRNVVSKVVGMTSSSLDSLPQFRCREGGYRRSIVDGKREGNVKLEGYSSHGNSALIESQALIVVSVFNIDSNVILGLYPCRSGCYIPCRPLSIGPMKPDLSHLHAMR